MVDRINTEGLGHTDAQQRGMSDVCDTTCARAAEHRARCRVRIHTYPFARIGQSNFWGSRLSVGETLRRVFSVLRIPVGMAAISAAQQFMAMPVLRAAGALAMAIALSSAVHAQGLASAGSSLCGTVRSDPLSDPIEGVRVDVLDAMRFARTDAYGGYCLFLSTGAHRLLISRPGYVSQPLSVVVGDDSVMTLDVFLVAIPVHVQERQVRVSELHRWHQTGPRVWLETEPGERRLLPHGDPALNNADGLASVTYTPDGVGSGPESGASLHVRGGSADQNLILLDGVPVYQPYHISGAVGTLSPDLVTDGRLHAGIPTARLGGALSSIVELRSRNPDTERWTAAGGVTDGLAGFSAGGPLLGDRASFMVGGRTSVRGVPGFSTGASNTDIGVNDFFGKAVVPLRGGVLELFSFSASDQLAFAAIVDHGPAVPLTPVVGETTAIDQATAAQAGRNRFVRAGSTIGLVWYGDSSAMPRTGARLWRAESVTSADWLASAGAVRLNNDLSSLGASADATWQVQGGEVSAGFQLERLRTQYRVSRTPIVAGPNPVPVGLPALSFGTARVFASPFVETRWRLDPRLTVTVGARDQLAAGVFSGIEPRVTVRFLANRWLSLAAGVGRIHQPLQALSNNESIFATFLGGALPVVLEGPLARVDRAALGARIALGQHATLTLDAYSNRLDALTQVAPTSALPFAVDSVSRSRGHSSGLLLGLDYQSKRVTAHAAYAHSVADRAADGIRYVPSNGDSHSFSAAIAYRAGAATFLRATMWAATGRRTTLAAGNLEWSPAPLLMNGEDLAGGSMSWLGALGAASLPAFVRVDVGISHAWAPHVMTRTLSLTGRIGVMNVLGRDNARGLFVPASTGVRQFAPMLPRTLTFGLEWVY